MVEFVGVHWTTIIKYYVYTPHCSCNAAVDWQPSRLSALNSHRLSNLYVWLVCIMTRKYSAALNSIAHVKSWEILGWNEVHDIHVVEVSDTLFMFLLCNWALNQFPPAEIFLFEIYVFEMDRIIDSSDPPLPLAQSSKNTAEVNYRHGGHLWGSNYICLRSFGATTTKPLKLQGTWPGKWVLNSLPDWSMLDEKSFNNNIHLDGYKGAG